MWKKYFYISFIFNMVVIVTFLFFTFGMPSEKSPKNRVLEHPLSPQQKSQLEVIKTERNSALDPIRLTSLENRKELMELLMESKLDTARIIAQLQKIITDENELKQIRYSYYLREKEILTYQQRLEQIQGHYETLSNAIEKIKGKMENSEKEK